jgi:hypothetical protein
MRYYNISKLTSRLKRAFRNKEFGDEYSNALQASLTFLEKLDSVKEFKSILSKDVFFFNYFNFKNDYNPAIKIQMKCPHDPTDSIFCCVIPSYSHKLFIQTNTGSKEASFSEILGIAESMILSYIQKKMVTSSYIYKGKVVTASSKQEAIAKIVTAFNKDTIRENTKLFFEDMNKGEFFYNYRIDKNFQDFIDNTLEDEIHDIIRSDKNLIRQCIEKRVANHSIVWAALYQIFEDVRKRWNLEAKVNNELIKNWFAYNDTDYKTALKKIVDNLTDFREELRDSELFKEGDKVRISGDISNGDYNCRVSSTGVVEENQKTPNSKIRVTIDEIDGDRNVSMLVNPNIVTLASTKNIIVAKKETPKPMTIKEAKEYKNFNPFEKKLNEICKRCEYHLPFSDHTYDIVKALKRNKNKIFEGYFKKYKNNLAYFERYINKIAKDIFNNGRFNSSILASSNKYLYNGKLITASTKQEAISKIVAAKMSLEEKIDNAKTFNAPKIKIKNLAEFRKLVLDNWHEGEYETDFETEVRYKFKNLWKEKFDEATDTEWSNLQDYCLGDYMYLKDDFIDSVCSVVNELHHDSNYGDLRDAYEEWKQNQDDLD